MLAIGMGDFLLIKQFSTRENIELPREIRCSSDGGAWLSNSKSLKFEANGEYGVDIHTEYFRLLGIRIMKPLGKAVFDKPAWLYAGDDEDKEKVEAKRWQFRTLFGFLLLSAIK